MEWRIFISYLLLLFILILSNSVFAQVRVTHFNAGWNSGNGVDWFSELGDCDKNQLLIEDADNQKKYQIAIVPTIVIFDDGEEVKRFQADLSFKMSATRQEVQDYIDELIMSKF